ncbi:hypothetical protein AB0P12_10170 [Streptomyces subrutilus]|uniref:Uncharacterized protein n=1 Tax=Streptomyces subrutilus TaxID=36818 RepID=A0A5P2UDS6_9ACTN|nr:hypothetical protein [Streptomyces subrutilus]QEU77372.1 hypothetical protein CP968_02895 [Streptomyces subrutilus]WSJ33547.1 hypothetical protein OG479_31935 [Streptomyces subrutilus]GGZ46946.1 hypothetical protein GCM10010371_02680 [Streptomyces subrutilus]
MRDPHRTPLVAAPAVPPEPSPLPCCPVCDERPERISWRQRPGLPVVLVFEPCDHRWTSSTAPVLTVTPPPAAHRAGGA